MGTDHPSGYSRYPKFEEYLIAVDDYRLTNPRNRRGQAYYNTLSKLYPDLAKLINGSKHLDPYFDDSKVEAFLQFVFENLEQISAKEETVKKNLYALDRDKVLEYLRTLKGAIVEQRQYSDKDDTNQASFSKGQEIITDNILERLSRDDMLAEAKLSLREMSDPEGKYRAYLNRYAEILDLQGIPKNIQRSDELPEIVATAARYQAYFETYGNLPNGYMNLPRDKRTEIAAYLTTTGIQTRNVSLTALHALLVPHWEKFMKVKDTKNVPNTNDK